MNSRLRIFLARHLYSYLAVLVGMAVGLSILFARDELRGVLERFSLPLLAPVVGLSLVNYALRFLKWHRLLRQAEAALPLGSSARIFYACLSMVVTPARLGELYKLVFLKRLHGIELRRGAPVLFVERLTDILAVVALVAARLGRGWGATLPVLGFLALSLFAGALLALPLWRRRLVVLLSRLPWLGERATAVDQILQTSARLLRPRAFGPALVLSVAAWWCECLGLSLVLRGLSAPVPVEATTWIYAVATAVGNLTFLPGGLGSTEATLVGFLRTLGVSLQDGLGATLLIRACTLWFAVFLGLGVTLAQRRALRWSEVREETAAYSEP